MHQWNLIPLVKQDHLQKQLLLHTLSFRFFSFSVLKMAISEELELEVLLIRTYLLKAKF